MDDQSKVEAMNRTQMVVTFSVDGVVVSANNLFLDALGVSLEEVNQMFVEDADCDEHRQLWENLRSGKIQVREKGQLGQP
jgi:methyl-accepting chemotaxis protein